MNFLEELRRLDTKDVGRWPLLFRALAIGILFVALSGAFIYLWPIRTQMPDLELARKQEIDLTQTFDERQRKAANFEAYKAQLKEMERSFGAMLRQLPGRTEVPSLLVDISQTGLAAGLQEKLFQPAAEVRKDFYAELPPVRDLRLRHRGAAADRHAARHLDRPGGQGQRAGPVDA